jgi:CheY-like chemotaxis protein
MVRAAEHLRRESSVPVHVLIVEDERVSRQVLGRLLERNGYHVELVESAEDALALLRQRLRPDVVLLDVDLPGMNGLELLARLRTMMPGVMPVLLTGADRDTVWPATSRGVPYLRKPIDFNRLLDVLDHSVGPA